MDHDQIVALCLGFLIIGMLLALVGMDFLAWTERRAEQRRTADRDRLIELTAPYSRGAR